MFDSMPPSAASHALEMPPFQVNAWSGFFSIASTCASPISSTSRPKATNDFVVASKRVRASTHACCDETSTRMSPS